MNATVQAPAENEPKLSTVDPPPQANSGPQETAGTPPSGDACSGAANIYVCDHQFIREIRKLQLIRSIQLDERVQQPPEISQLWSLLELRYGRNGRWPYARERADLDRVSVVLSSTMTDSIKKRWVSSQVPMLIAWLPLAMLIVAGVTLGLSVYAAAGAKSETLGVLHKIIHWVLQFLGLDFHLAHNNKTDSDQFVVAYLFWSVSMGVIGAAASVGMNAISVLNDATYDISSRHQIWLRVTLGGVFALVLVLPFGLANFVLFCYYAGHLLIGDDATSKAALLADVSQASPSLAYAASKTSSMMYAFALLAPFLVGYSTSLVTNVLSKLINDAQQYLGSAPGGSSEKKSQPSQPSTAPAPAQ
ncbi:MAG: hypothetical protein JOY65_08940 [Acetobacteraceae bacterium]|nr:hypothetical protein [Acetobacteraceae bacterium]